jgi:hypothetical protein
MAIRNQTTRLNDDSPYAKRGLGRRGLAHSGERLRSETDCQGTTKPVSQRKAISLAGLIQAHHACSPKMAGCGSRELDMRNVLRRSSGEVSFRGSKR